MIIAGYSKDGCDSIEKWVKKGETGDYAKVWTSDIKAPSYIDYDDDCLLAITASKQEGVLHYFEAEGEGYKKVDELVFDTMGLCHIAYLRKSGLVLASSYHQGVLVVARIASGKFDRSPAFIHQQPGQDGLSRIHCAVPNCDESLVYVANIATDQIYVYKVKEEGLEQFKVIDVKEGCGPRHIVVDDARNRLYVVTEYSCDVIVIDINGDDYQVNSYHPMLPEGFEGVNDGGAIDVSGDNRFLYVTNRGHDSVACFNIENEVKRFDIYTHTGHWPRHMSMVTDTLVGVANRRENMVELIERDPLTGKLLGRVATFDYIEPSFVH